MNLKTNCTLPVDWGIAAFVDNDQRGFIIAETLGTAEKGLDAFPKSAVSFV